jgi:hypothetical protein
MMHAGMANLALTYNTDVKHWKFTITLYLLLEQQQKLVVASNVEWIQICLYMYIW